MEDFVQWALADARTIEERYTIELLVEMGVRRWNSQRKIYESPSLDELVAQARERKLNPAYEPHYSEDGLRKTAEFLPQLKNWSAIGNDRPVRSFEPLRFCPALESLSCAFGEPTDLSPLAALPALRTLAIGYPGAGGYNTGCVDYTPLTRCTALRELTLGFGALWPDFTGIDRLQQLEVFHLSGNLHALPRGLSFSRVRQGSLYCLPLAARNVADLPQFPACEFFTLFGAEKLEGIEAMPRLRNLTLIGPFQSFAPLTPLHALTCLTVKVKNHGDQEKQPRDVAPLTRLPHLHYFQIGPDHYGEDMPRDYSPLAEAPALRQLVVQRCPPVEMEVAAINAGLPPWDDLFLAPEPRPLPPLRMIIAPLNQHPGRNDPTAARDELPDIGLRQCEQRWVSAYLQRLISERIGHEDWGVATADAADSFQVNIESFEVVERLPEILEAARTAISHLRADYLGNFMISLIVRPPTPTPAQKELDQRLQNLRDEWESAQREADQKRYLENLHQLELKKQLGDEIDPAEFSPAEQPPYPEMDDILPPAEDNDDQDDGNIAVETDPDPPLTFLDDDEHPLAANYRCFGHLTLSEVWFTPHSRGIAVHLMQREPDLEVPEDPKPD